MFKSLFGRKNDKRAGTAAETISMDGEMPWGPEEADAANGAVSRLTEYLMADLKGPRGVHIETMLTIVGALAGFSAQHVIWETIVKPGKLPVHGVGAAFNDGAFVLAEAVTAEKFYFGDLLNSYLVPTGGELAKFGPGRYTLWGFVTAAVIRCGRKPLTREEIGEIFSNTAATVGSALFGEPRLPKVHRPAMLPRNALNRAWPKVRDILARPDPASPNGSPLSVSYWPMVIGLVAQNSITQAKDVIDPVLAMRIVFEAAIPMSKVDPTTVPQ
jgi:hypothetical protein